MARQFLTAMERATSHGQLAQDTLLPIVHRFDEELVA